MKTPRGSVTEHHTPDGRIRYRVRVTLAGQRKSLGLYDSEAEAHAVLAEALEQVADEARGGLTLRQWGERWLDRREKSGLHRAAHIDRGRWRTHVNTAEFADWPMRRIARTDIVRWVRELLRKPALRTVTTGRGAARVTRQIPTDRPCSRQTVTHALNLVRRALSDAADEGHVPVCVAHDVRVPPVPRTTETWTYLTAAEIDRLLALDLRPEQRAIYTVAIYTGLRAGEMYGLRWCDVVTDGEHPELIVRHSYRGPTKSGQVRRVPLLSPALAAVIAWRAVAPGIGDALVFPSAGSSGRGQGGCHHHGYSAGLRGALAAAGIARRVRLHDLRHTCASHLVMGTWTPRPWRLEDVRQMLGHSTITITERYAHLSPDGIRALASDARKNAGLERVSDTSGTLLTWPKSRNRLFCR